MCTLVTANWRTVCNQHLMLSDRQKVSFTVLLPEALVLLPWGLLVSSCSIGWLERDWTLSSAARTEASFRLLWRPRTWALSVGCCITWDRTQTNTHTHTQTHTHTFVSVFLNYKRQGNILKYVAFITNKHEFPYWGQSANLVLTKLNLFWIKIWSNKDESPIFRLINVSLTFTKLHLKFKKRAQSWKRAVGYRIYPS